MVLLATDDHTLLGAPDGTLTDSGLAPGALAYGPNMTDHALAAVSARQSPRTLVIESSRGSVTVQTYAGLPFSSTVLWTTDDRAVFVDTGSTDAQQVMDQLLRVPVP